MAARSRIAVRTMRIPCMCSSYPSTDAAETESLRIVKPFIRGCGCVVGAFDADQLLSVNKIQDDLVGLALSPLESSRSLFILLISLIHNTCRSDQSNIYMIKLSKIRFVLFQSSVIKQCTRPEEKADWKSEWVGRCELRTC